MIQAELRIAAGNKQGSTIPLPQGKFLIGREEDCHLRPNSDLVSRHHCVFTVDDFSVRLRDLGSTNGTFVNGERLKGAVMLKAGDRVVIGKLDVEVVLREASSPAPQGSVETVMIAGSPESSSASTQFAMPVVNLPGQTPVDATTSEPPIYPTVSLNETQPMYPPPGGGMLQAPGMPPVNYGMPMGYPQQQPYMQNPYGYPGYPPAQMPMGGYYGQPMGYPQAPMGQMLPPGYGMPQPMMPMAPPELVPSDATADKDALGVRLPDPSTTGAKESAPPAAAPAAVAGAPVVHIPTAAADIIKQYQTRR